MKLLNSILALGAVGLTAAQNVTVRINSTSIAPPIRSPVPIIIPPNAINGSKPGVQPGKPGFTNGTVVVIVKSYTTYCPEPTVVVVKGQSYTATGPTMLTITNCPCTFTKVRVKFLSFDVPDSARRGPSHPCCKKPN